MELFPLSCRADSPCWGVCSARRDGHARQIVDGQRKAWLTLAACSIGDRHLSMHFVAMLGFSGQRARADRFTSA
jgi:hypothetical protein